MTGARNGTTHLLPRLPRCLRAGEWRDALIDVLVVLVFAACYVLVLFLLPESHTGFWWWPALVSVAALCSLLVRRRLPWIPLLVLLGVTIGFTHLEQPVGPLNLAILVSVYSVCLRTELFGTLCAALLAMIWPITKLPLMPIGDGVLMLVGSLVNVVMIVGWGRSMRVKRNHAAQLERTVALLDEARDQLAAEAATLERARIAREFHDIVSHNLSVVALRAGVARSLVERNPEHARETLGELEQTSRSSLEQMRGLLGALRGESGDAQRISISQGELEQRERRPAPGLDQVDELIDSVRDTGVAWRLDRLGEVRELGPGVEMTAYRIVQEAVTNVLKHANTGYARVQLEYRRCSLRIEVSNHTTSNEPEALHSTIRETSAKEPVGKDSVAGDDGEILTGHGLIGLRERVSLLGGALTAHPVPSGFHLSAVLPCPETSDLV